MGRHVIPWLILAVLPLSTALQAAELLQARYEASYRGFELGLIRSLTSIGDRQYRFDSVADSAIARIEESSTFSLDAGGNWMPQHYRYRQKIFGISRGYELQFDPENRSATYIDNGERRHLGLEPGTLDPLLYQLKMQHDLAHEQDRFSYRFLRRGKLKHYEFRLEGPDNLELNGRELKTLRLAKEDEDADESTRIWFSPGNGYQLARLSYSDEGASYRIDLDEIRIAPGFENWLQQ